jgi:hypothetical protein
MGAETLEMLSASVASSVEQISELVGRPVTWSYHEGSTCRLVVDGIATLVDLDEEIDVTWADHVLGDDDELHSELNDLLCTLERVAVVAAREFVVANGGTYQL